VLRGVFMASRSGGLSSLRRDLRSMSRIFALHNPESLKPVAM
jgi:hypothetical protein